MSPVDRNGLEILERDACLELLATATIGRLAYTSGGVPAVVPVNVALAGDLVLFRLGKGSALATVYSGKLVALETDAIDPDTCCGWSVNVVGAPAEIPAALAGAAGQGLKSWLRSDTTRLFSLKTDDVKGRRLLPRPADGTESSGGT
jgi:hypothetical protein